MDFHAPPVGMIVLWALWVLQALWSLINVQRFHRRLHYQAERSASVEQIPYPNATVIVPVKGVDEHFDHHVQGLFNQDHGHYRLIFVTESRDDPAYIALSELIDRIPRSAGLIDVRIEAAGLAERGGQKVHNLLCGLSKLADADDEEAVIFADADAVPGDDWLTALTEATMRPSCGAVTGYRWFIPADRAWASSFVSVMNASVATMLGPRRRNHAWGGAMGMKLGVLRESKLTEYWQGALSDDYQMTRAVHAAGRQIYFMSGGLVASPVRFTWSRLIEFARRQYRITRVYAPLLWLEVAMVLTLYVAGWVSAIAGLIMGSGWALAAIAAVVLLDVLRGLERRQVIRELFGREVAATMGRAIGLDIAATPIWMTLHWLLAMSTAFGRRIRWAGVRYHMKSPQNVIIEGRNTPAADPRDAEGARG